MFSDGQFYLIFIHIDSLLDILLSVHSENHEFLGTSHVNFGGHIDILNIMCINRFRARALINQNIHENLKIVNHNLCLLE